MIKRKYLYKYKSGNDLDLSALKKDALWVSNYACLNDPSDFPIYSKSLSEEEIEDYYEAFRSSFSCISFSSTPYNRSLWNYYAGKMDGMVIAYQTKDIYKALSDYGIKTLYSNSVAYDGKKFDFSKQISQGKFKDIDPDCFFHKDESWKQEKEYRFVFENPTKKDGFLLPVKPHHIFIGYRMGKKKTEEIIEYCQKNNLYLYQIRPDHHSSDSSSYMKKILYGKKSDQIGMDYEEKLK